MAIGKYIQQMLLIAALSLAAATGMAQTPQLRLVGLGLHQETGRDIYLGGILIGELAVRPDNFVSAPGPRAMEYRIVARRTSIRSLLGSMLLQSELATGSAPDEAVADFADSLMSAVQGSLYAGDSLQIVLDDAGDTSAQLNGVELARAPGRHIADYLLQGWTSTKGASTVFRDALLQPDMNTGLLAQYDGLEATAERTEQVAAWNQSDDVEANPVAAEPTVLAAPASPIATSSATIATVAFTPTGEELETVAEDESAATLAAVTTEPAVPEPVTSDSPDTAEPPAQAQPATEQLALVTPAPVLEQVEQDPIKSLDVVEYSQRLGVFNTQLIKRVYANIRYPRSAVRRNIQGSLELDVTLDTSGTLQGVSVARSSGYKSLDASAVKAAEKAFNNKPIEDIDPVAVAEYADGDALIIPVPISFVLTE
jgi:TonB family protein